MAVDSSIIHAFPYYGMAGEFRMVILTNISLLPTSCLCLLLCWKLNCQMQWSDSLFLKH